jgi:uracil-DNA glycosylase family 4
MIVLDAQHRLEMNSKVKLTHDAGRLLRMYIAMLTIDRTDWVHDYCYMGAKKNLPTKKVERLTMLSGDIQRLDSSIELNRPCVIVAMGRLACEVLVGASLIKSRAGTCWHTDKYGKVWVTYPPDAALFDPSLSVDISAVLAKAAEVAGIEVKDNLKIPMFDWEPYEKKSHSRELADR